MIISLAHCFHKAPSDAADFLTNGNRKLNTVIVNGEKGDFKNVIEWYKDIYANSEHLSRLISIEVGNPTVLPMTLNTVKMGLLSEDPEVTSFTC